MHMVCMGSRGRQCSSEKTNRDSVASYHTDDSDCNGVWEGTR